MIRLDKRIVMVTGAAGAIGSACARAVVAAGGRVIAHDLDAAGIASLVDELNQSADEGQSPPATGFSSDLGDPRAGVDLWAECLTVHGRIDALANVAGIYPPAPLDAPIDDWLSVWDHSLAVNLKAPAVLCREAVATYAAQVDGGIIINIASRAAFRGEDPDYWHYAAAKAGVVAMTRTIARQNGRQGVTAFALAPGYVDTSLNRVFAETVGVEVAAADTGLGQVAQPEDVANVVTFLATGLARHATGTTIDINGASYVR